jgi:outer membrane lipoprotein carrier protein
MSVRPFARLAAATAAVAVLAIVTAPIAAGGQARPNGDLLDRAVAAWARVHTVRATFEQTIVNPLTGGSLHSSGEYQQQRPAKLSVRFDDPAADRVVADGRHVWLYLPSTTPGQVIRSDQAATGTGTVDLSAQFLTAPRSRFTVTESAPRTIAGHATHGYVLVPKSVQGGPFRRAVVQVDDADAMVREFTVTERSGVERTVRLTSYRLNVPVDKAAFTFIPPAGMLIVDR